MSLYYKYAYICLKKLYESEIRVGYIYVVIADVCLDVFEKAKVTDYMAFASHVKNMLDDGNGKLVSGHIIKIVDRVNAVYSFEFDEMIYIINKFFTENHYKDYLPVLKSVRIVFGSYLDIRE